MKHADCVVGERVTYYPAKSAETDNLHFPAVITAISAKRIQISFFSLGCPPSVGKKLTVSASRLMRGQPELPF